MSKRSAYLCVATLSCAQSPRPESSLPRQEERHLRGLSCLSGGPGEEWSSFSSVLLFEPAIHSLAGTMQIDEIAEALRLCENIPLRRDRRASNGSFAGRDKTDGRTDGRTDGWMGS